MAGPLAVCWGAPGKFLRIGNCKFECGLIFRSRPVPLPPHVRTRGIRPVGLAAQYGVGLLMCCVSVAHLPFVEAEALPCGDWYLICEFPVRYLSPHCWGKILSEQELSRRWEVTKEMNGNETGNREFEHMKEEAKARQLRDAAALEYTHSPRAPRLRWRNPGG